MMAIHKFAIFAMFVAAWTMGSTQVLAQSKSLSALAEGTKPDRDADDKRGVIESSQDEQGTVGSSAEAAREAFEELQGTGRERKNQDMSVEKINDRRRSRRRRSRQTPPPPVHVQLQPRFDFYQPASAQVATGVQARFTRLLETRNAGSVSVTIENRVATLSGNVRSEYERRLLEKLAKIEPGISRIENRIAIGVSQPNPSN